METSTLAFELRCKPKGFKSFKSGKKLRFFRGDKTEIISPNGTVVKPERDGILSRGAITTGLHAQKYLQQVQKLLNSAEVPSVEVALALQEYFPKKYQHHVRDYAHWINRVELPFKTWCDFFIDRHTSKSRMDPFVSVTTKEDQAAQYSNNLDECVYKIRVKGARVLNDALNRGRNNGTEFFILGAIKPEEISTF